MQSKKQYFSSNKSHIKTTGNLRPEVKGRDQCFKSRIKNIRIVVSRDNWSRVSDVGNGNRKKNKEGKTQYLILSPPLPQLPVLSY